MLCEGNFYYMKRGIQPNLQRQWVYYAVTDGGRDIMFASASELTSDALYIIRKIITGRRLILHVEI